MKKKYRTCGLLSFLVFIIVFCGSCAQKIPDPVLVEQISKIKAIDNYCIMLPASTKQGTDEEPADFECLRVMVAQLASPTFQSLAE